MKGLLNALVIILLCLPATSGRAQSSRPGWGATPYTGASGTGVTFRVWAPNATSVAAAGMFNGWSSTANLLVREGTTDVWSADVSSARTNQEYKYVVNGSLWRADPRSAEIRTSFRNSVIHSRTNFAWGGPFTNPPLKEMVVYEMHAGTFHDPTPANGVNATLIDAIAKLDHVRDLGANVVELMPVNDYPTATSWGYNPAYPFSVENAYGGPDALRQFVKAAHDRGIAVFIDIVHNHYGPDTDLWQFDGWTPNPSYGGIYFYNTNYLCCTPWGVTRPNYDTPHVRDYIKDTFRMWIEDYRIDGFRWDTPFHMIFAETNTGQYAFIPSGFSLIEETLTLMATQYPGRINIAENTKYFESFDSTWDTYFPYGLSTELTYASDASRSMFNISSLITGSGEGLRRVTYSESHDTVGNLNSGVRLPRAIDGASPTSYVARKRSMLGVATAFISPGIPMVFQGQEMLETEAFGDTLPVDWTKTNTYAAVTRFYRDLARLRRNLDDVSGGLQGVGASVTLVDNSAKLLVVHRYDPEQPGQDCVVVLNYAGVPRTNRTIPLPSSGTWHVYLNSDLTTYGADFSSTGSTAVAAGGAPATGQITIGPYAAMILSKVPRAAALESAHAIDLPLGNGDGWIDPGEVITEQTLVRNRNAAPASNVIVNLQSADTNVYVIAATSPVPTIAGGALGTNAQTISYHVSRFAPCGSVVTMEIVVASAGSAVTSVVQRTLGRPLLSSTQTNMYESADVPKAIVDLATIASTTTLTSINGEVIEDVNVRVRLDHTWDADLELVLRHPDGTAVILASRRGGSRNNFGTNACPGAIRTVFDDEAATAINAGTAPFLGSYRPEGILSALDGKTLDGAWRLEINDNFGADDGTLLCWALEIEVGNSVYVCTPTNQAPVATPVPFVAMESQPTNVVLGGLDYDGDALTFHVSDVPDHGVLTSYAPTGPNHRYEPIRNFTGADSIAYSVGDGISTSTASAMSITVLPLPDTDGDGLPDDWEVIHGGDATNAVPDQDDDGDGVSNIDEFRAGTAAGSDTSVLVATEITQDEQGHVVLRWPSVGRTRYRIEYADQPDVFVPVARPLADELDPAPYGVPSSQTFVDDFSLTPPLADGSTRQYRVRVLSE